MVTLLARRVNRERPGLELALHAGKEIRVRLLIHFAPENLLGPGDSERGDL